MAPSFYYGLIMDFYTSSVKYGNNILYRGVKDGRRVKLKIEYQPTLYTPSKVPTNFKSLHGDYLEAIKFENIKDAGAFVKRYEGVSNFSLFGNTGYAYSFIADEFKGPVDWDKEPLKIDVVDIEVFSEDGFPKPEEAKYPITAITTTRFGGSPIIFGYGDYRKKDNETYIKCRDEIDLCQRFINHFEYDCPDILTGWNIRGFDVPYLYNRFKILLGEKEAKRLSPWGLINIKTTFQKGTGKELTSYDIVGIANLDYIDLYKKFAKGGNSRDSYRLDNIANIELGKGKLSYDEFDNLQQLYQLNYQKYIEYNVIDTTLIIDLDDKLKLIDLALTLAYDSKSNYEDVFTQTRMWDALIYNYLLERNIIVPFKVGHDKDSDFDGAYVKEPQVGMHKWVASFDLNSLYPHLIMQYNISPETLIEPEEYDEVMYNIISDGVSVDKMLDKTLDLSGISGCTITPNGQFFKTGDIGFLPEMLGGMYLDRKKYKDLQLKAEQEYEDTTDKEEKKRLSKLISRYYNLQLAKKVCLNSAYGILGTPFFRFFDIRMAAAVTSSGQLSIRWVEKKLNQYLSNILKNKKEYVVYVDTDSNYLCLEDLVNKYCPNQSDPNVVIKFMDKVCEDKIQPFIDRSYQELADYTHAYAQKMVMKREVLADRGIWTAKKRYILNVYNSEGVQYNEPKLKVTGLDMIKSSTPAIVREKMKELIKLLMTKDEGTIQRFIEDFRESFKTLNAEDISFPRGVNGLSAYTDSATIYKKGTPIHVKGSLYYNLGLKDMGLEGKYPKIQEGEKIKFIYLKMPNPLKTPVISFPSRIPVEFGLEGYIDSTKQFEKTFLSPISVILDCIGWSVERVNTLDSFFS